MALEEVLRSRTPQILRRWEGSVRGKLAPESLPTLELTNHLPEFLVELASCLEGGNGREPAGDGGCAIPAKHGEQRLRLGFSLDAVVREYGELQDAILDEAFESGVQMTLPETHILFGLIIDGIARAVAQYVHLRDAEQVRQANEHFAFIAHELRSPLSTAVAAYEVLSRNGSVPPEDRMTLALGRALRQTRELIDQTLHMSRTASGIEVRREWVTLEQLAVEAAESVVADAEASEVTVGLGPIEDARIPVDVRLIRSALGNLVKNAVKYSCRGGHVDLRGRVEHGVAVLEVEDCCGGVPPGLIERAFAPFVRLEEGEEGFGLGLAIARQAVDAHGGGMRVQNLPGKGCVFVLELPIASAA